MGGVKAFGAYVPRYRLGKETSGWGRPTEKAVANFDEDSVTMAVAAGTNCLDGLDRREIDGLLFATTTPPYVEKQGAAIIATALDLRRDIFTADVTGVLRAGTSALKMAMDSIEAGSAKQVLVVAADSRLATPRGEMERNLGDGAAALLVAKDGDVATIEGTHSVTENMLDMWRSQGDPFVRSWEDRFMNEEGVDRILPETVKEFMEKSGLSPQDFSRVAFYAPDARRHSQLGRRMGFSEEQLQDPLFGKVGNTGASYPLLLLAAALEEAKEGDLLLTASYGDGSDVLSFRVNGAVEGWGNGRGVSAQDRVQADPGKLRDLRPLAGGVDVRRRSQTARPQRALGDSHLAGVGPEHPPIWGQVQCLWLPPVPSPEGLHNVPGEGRLGTRPHV